jgi:CheY-like chemotaxis protein
MTPMIDVLIVDDSAGSRLLVERALRMANADIGTCHQAANGIEALEMLKKVSVQLLLTDLHMDTMDGRELIKWLRTQPAYQKLLIAVLTSEHSEATKTEMEALGAAFYLVKPLTPRSIGELFSKVKELIG